MEYTLKCDIQTQHDGYECGEWDYLTYSTIFQPTGNYDSNTYYQPSLSFINREVHDTIFYTENPTYSYFREHLAKGYHYGLGGELGHEVASMWTLNGDIFDTEDKAGRSQFIWTADEILASGLEAGNIDGIRLFAEDNPDSFDRFTVSYKIVETEAFEFGVPEKDLIEVYDYSLSGNDQGMYELVFHTPILWDGVSNILLEFAYTNQESTGGNRIFVSQMDTTRGVYVTSTDKAIDLDGRMDFIQFNPMTSAVNESTIEAWVYVKSYNNWNRLFDFGNGPGKDNILFALSKGTSGKPYFSIRKGTSSYNLESPVQIPLNEWTHIAVTINTGSVSLMFINGEIVTGGYIPTVPEITREIAYMGRSNWANDKYANVRVADYKVYDYAKDMELLKYQIHEGVANPTTEDGLITYYSFDNIESNAIVDLSVETNDGQALGYPAYYSLTGNELMSGFELTTYRPNISFITYNESEFEIIETTLTDSVVNPKDQILVFEDSETLTIPVDTIALWTRAEQYVYENGIVVDTIPNARENYMLKEDIVYYGEPFMVTNNFEIARYITPYGIGLDLGDDGFKWVYDVTDYAHLLKGDVDFKAGNQQELIDVKFKLIKGTPPRDLIKMDTIWGHRRSYRYNYLGGDSAIMSRDIQLEDEAKMFKVISRITGHGHNSNDGSYPHCCEWKDNTHYLYVNGEEAANWHIWQTDDCAWNPVYPQGGTWPGAREGWCPGDVVKDFEFEITNLVNGNTVNLDYGITDVPQNNLGMGWGNYVITKYLAQYGAPNFENDVEIYDVINPNDWEYYARKNPICKDPQIIIRNNGMDTLKTLTISYGVEGGNFHEFEWEGNLPPMYKEKISLPAVGDYFWMGDGSNIFSATVSNPNGKADEYAENDNYKTHFVMPDQLEGEIIVEYRTNNQTERYNMIIKDLDDNVVYEKGEGLEPRTVYRDTLYLEEGCYKLEITDTENMGLSYWAYPGQGSGYFRFRTIEDNVMKSFRSEFGHRIDYAFRVGETMYIPEQNQRSMFSLSPNPATDQVHVDIENIDESVLFEIISAGGKVLYSEQIDSTRFLGYRVDVSGFVSGMYIVRITGGGETHSEKLLIQ
jgi:hypothetical protein